MCQNTGVVLERKKGGIKLFQYIRISAISINK